MYKFKISIFINLIRCLWSLFYNNIFYNNCSILTLTKSLGWNSTNPLPSSITMWFQLPAARFCTATRIFRDWYRPGIPGWNFYGNRASWDILGSILARNVNFWVQENVDINLIIMNNGKVAKIENILYFNDLLAHSHSFITAIKHFYLNLLNKLVGT